MTQGPEDLRATRLYGYRYMDIWMTSMTTWTYGYMKKDIYRYMGIWIYTNISIDILIYTLYLMCIYRDMNASDHSITDVHDTTNCSNNTE